MKILHLLYSGLGGHGNVFFSMVNADSAAEFEYEAIFNGVEDIRAEYVERCELQKIKWSFVKKKSGLDIEFYKNLVLAIKKSDADIIFLHGSTQILWAKLAIIFSKKRRSLLVRETHANQLKVKQDWLWLIMTMLLANKIIFLSEAYKLEIKKKLSWIYAEKKVTVIANGIDLQKYNAVGKKEDGTIVLGMQSRIVKIKDQETLIGAFDMLLKDESLKGKDIVLKIAGDGDNRTSLEQLAKKLGIENKVFFTGMLPEQELTAFLNDLDIYIHASFGETMSTAIMQAMAFGKPIIASDVAGINNMVKNNVTGLLVPVMDEEAMFGKMKQLIQNKEEAFMLAANARQYAEANFSNETMFKKYRSVFSSQ
ncbi:MAG: glycosyltransferase family 4 protein [Ferruginibacter sp.]